MSSLFFVFLAFGLAGFATGWFSRKSWTERSDERPRYGMTLWLSSGEKIVFTTDDDRHDVAKQAIHVIRRAVALDCSVVEAQQQQLAEVDRRSVS